MIYRKLSIQKVKKDHPSWNMTEIKIQARKEFNEAAKLILILTYFK